LPSSMRCERGSKRRFPRECAPLACAAPAISASPKRTCNIWGLPLRLIWCVWGPGLMGMNWLPHASRLSRGFTWQLKGVSQQCQKRNRARICVKFRLPFLSESSRKLFGREPLETQLLNPMALFLNLLAHFSRTWACFSYEDGSEALHSLDAHS